MKVVVLLLASLAYSTASPVSLQSISKFKTVEWTSLLEAKHRNGLGDIWSNCSQSSDPLKINKVTILPNPPKSQQPLSVTINVTLSEEVISGKIKVSLRYGIIPIYSDTFDLCSKLPLAGAKCPLPKGVNILTIKETLPDIPSGHYTGGATATDQNGKELVCITLDMHF